MLRLYSPIKASNIHYIDQITRIIGLDSLVNLQRLDLSHNQITRIGVFLLFNLVIAGCGGR